MQALLLEQKQVIWEGCPILPTVGLQAPDGYFGVTALCQVLFQAPVKEEGTPDDVHGKSSTETMNWTLHTPVHTHMHPRAHALSRPCGHPETPVPTQPCCGGKQP